MMDKNRDLAQMQDQFDKASGAKGASGGVEDFKGSGVESERTREGVILRLDDAVFFSTGKAALSREGQRILTRVAGIINRKYPRNVIRVEGHTDDVPVKKVKNAYPTNWELSTARACSVVRHLVSSGGVNPHRVYPAGFSYYRPRVNGTNPGSRSKNRRVEILILDQKR
jgi:chemotaxis protein MotB